MNVTVVICTYNRSDSLAAALNTVAGSILPRSVEWEVLVVDNNSSDRTHEVVQALSQLHPGRFRYLFEPRPGKSYALNAGVREARGDIVAFMDDDVSVEPAWLRNLTKALQGGKWAGVGGRVVLQWACVPPEWLAVEGPYNLAGILAQFDLGADAAQLDKAPIGANMAFRREMFEKYGGFRTDLGPSPNRETPRPNEDTEFGRRLMAAGERLRYEPEAVVYHGVPEQRLDKKYFLDWWFDYGRAREREVARRPNVWGIPRHYLSIPSMGSAALVTRALHWTFSVDPQKKFFRKCLVWTTVGQMVEIWRISRATPHSLPRGQGNEGNAGT